MNTHAIFNVIWLIVLSAFISCSSAESDWQAKSAPIMSRWAEEVSPDHVHQEYPRPQMVRDEWINLNGLWQFAIADIDETPPFGNELPEQILVPFAMESALSGVQQSAQRAWYRRSFTVPATWESKRVLLHFGAVDWQTRVWINKVELGQHRGGYDAFCFDITDALGDQKLHELVVHVYDPTDDGVNPRGKQVGDPSGIFYTAVTGIWQTVWLEAVGKNYITSVQLQPDIDEQMLKIKIQTSHDVKDLRTTIQALDGDKLVGEAEGLINHTIHIPVSGAKLWTPDNPVLYDLRVRLLDNGNVIDSVESYFAMRKISLGKDDQGITRMMLNNQFVFQVGPLDQGYWPDGLYTAPTDEALRYDIEMAKKLGFNMIRKHTKVEPFRWYYWCDKLGMLVWQDMPSVSPDNFVNRQTPEDARQFEQELKAMITNLQPFPSIIMWVVFNEGWGQFDTERLTALVKQMDPTRLVNNASGWTDKHVGDIIDIHSYPGPDAPYPEEARAAVLGEFGGLGLPIAGHTWTIQNWGYLNLKSREELRDRYEQLFDEVWALKDEPGLSAVVYTQITDVETETNGLMTYDREIIKLDINEARAFHSDRLISPPTIEPNGSLFLDTIQVSISNRKHETIYYTLDGSDPDERSLTYESHLIVDHEAVIMARSIGVDGRMSSIKSARFEKTTMQKGVTPPAGLSAG
ncbi:chitobiase/beta-hexosaminidase C-terminal domain-containing protein, partial [candidate division KSB1 bacterium]|nr:chitobiase/beta-hexosaminidase C-terminal domain-containing protein [candidate division KSB1 bacterium]